ncbi:hypothetical protein SAMD00019534_024560 [Acytostelium subglobosum LB1]|uniref:hypothetical protein n=1 Tax=Acytostelium subglobosum LB1 TaxID=1410327 RepID=UPI000644EA3E|nr:hypothetical protein SAMD00019534_024560 [Acytostelium subglobosum LB1]GAM19281.1 hypothetical protein SAMD00019534_024560 [Acytostelium subglobosum LB1]|eukprot:XP_012757208.1 hypothetical protein SAMD00019534_024560 [Acytostelium subglobosum LB1]
MSSTNSTGIGKSTTSTSTTATPILPTTATPTSTTSTTTTTTTSSKPAASSTGTAAGTGTGGATGTAGSLKRLPIQEIDDKKIVKKKRTVGPLTIAEEDFIANAFRNVPDSKLSTDVRRIKRKFLLREQKRKVDLEMFNLDDKIHHYTSHVKKKDQRLSLYFEKDEIPSFTKKPLHSLESLNVTEQDKLNELVHPLQVFDTQLQQQQLLQQQMEKKRLEQEQLKKQQQEKEEKLVQERLRQEKLEKERLEQQRLEQERLAKLVPKPPAVIYNDGVNQVTEYFDNGTTTTKERPIVAPPSAPPPSSTDKDTNMTATATSNGYLAKLYHWDSTNQTNQQQQQLHQQQQQQKTNNNNNITKIIKPFQRLKDKIASRDNNIDLAIQPFISPFTTRELKAFIRRDYETVPGRVLMLRELYQFFVANHMVQYSPLDTEFYPIDYRYLTPDLVDKTQWFLCDAFWPGIDLSEVLEYPDYTVVAMYRSMVVGCGIMNPDGYVMFLSVRPDWQATGIGSFMLYHLTQTMIGRDITLHVSTNNAAMVLYQKFGFKIEEYIANFYDKYYREGSGRSKDAYLLRMRR